MKVVCKICGRSFETLSSHMSKAHKITTKEYLEIFPGSRILSDEYEAKQSTAMSARNAKGEFSNYISERNRENWTKEEYRESLVLMMIKKRNSAVLGKHYSTKCLSFVSYKSMTELDYAIKLDSDENVLNYDSESIAIWYETATERKMYIPDFIVNYRDGHTEVVEIKAEDHNRAHDDLLPYKFSAAREYCQKNGYLFKVIKG